MNWEVTEIRSRFVLKDENNGANSYSGKIVMCSDGCSRLIVPRRAADDGLVVFEGDHAVAFVAKHEKEDEN